MATELIIQAEGFLLACPYCDAELETLSINRLAELANLVCDECYETYAITITVEPG